jgi:hypothetical protein
VLAGQAGVVGRYAALDEERAELGDTLEVGLNRAGRSVGGAEVEPEAFGELDHVAYARCCLFDVR